MNKKILQVPVVIGKGEQQFFIEKEISFPPACPPVYMIKDIKKWIDVYDMKAVRGKVIFNAFLWKDINYKTVERAGDDFVCGPVYHYTTKIPFGGFVEIKPEEKKHGDKINEEDEKCEKMEVDEGDKAELLEAVVEGERDDWCGETQNMGVKVYTKLIEKTVVRLKFKITRIEEVKIEEKDKYYE